MGMIMGVLVLPQSILGVGEGFKKPLVLGAFEFLGFYINYLSETKTCSLIFKVSTKQPRTNFFLEELSIYIATTEANLFNFLSF